MKKANYCLMPKIEPFDEYSSEYDDWYDKYVHAYQSELEAIRSILPPFDKGIEIGVGSGRFAAPLRIRQGLEPSRKMASLAAKRGIKVTVGVAEKLPFESDNFDLVLMVTVICFLDDVAQAFREAHRILKWGGHIVVGFIDRDSPLGQIYHKSKSESPFFRFANFYSANEVSNFLKAAGFINQEFCQTIFKGPEEIDQTENVEDGHGQGLFAVVKAKKKSTNL